MTPFYKIAAFFFLLLLSVLPPAIHSAVAQTSLCDSLVHKLRYLQEKATDAQLIKALQDAGAVYQTCDTVDLLFTPLLVADSLLVRHTASPDKQVIIVYRQDVIRFLKGLPLSKAYHPLYRTLNNQALLYNDIGQFEKALLLYQEVESMVEKKSGKDHPDYARSLNNVANAYMDMGRFEAALPLYQQALAIRRRTIGEAHADYARSLNNLAILYHEQGQYEKVLPLYQEARAIWLNTSGENHPDHARSLNNLSILYFDMGQYEKALPYCQQALAIWKATAGEDDPSYVQTLNNLANLFQRTGQFEKALPLRQQVLRIRKKNLGEEHPEYAAGLDNLARFYEHVGLYKQSLPLYQQALAIWRRTLGSTHPSYAQTLNNLGMLYVAMGSYEKALPHYEEALAIRKKVLGEEHPHYALSLNNLAFLNKNIGRYDKALQLYRHALAIRKEKLGSEHPEYAQSLEHLANLYDDMGDHRASLPLYEEALDIKGKTLGAAHPGYARTLNNLGIVHLALHQTESAADQFTPAADILLKHLERTYPTLSEQEKITFLKKEASQFSYLPSLLFLAKDPRPSMLQQCYANELALKGMVLEHQGQVMHAFRKSNDSAAIQLYETWYLNKMLVGKQLLLPVGKRLAYLDSLQEVTTELEQQLSRQAAAFKHFQHNKHLTSIDIWKRLKKGEAAIEFIHFNYFNKKWTDSVIYAALLLLPGDSIARFIPLFEEKQLRRLLAASLSAKTTLAQYAAIQKLYTRNFRRSPGDSQNLYKLIWQPIQKYLSGIDTIYYAPSGLLHRIAFQALEIDSTHLLIDRFDLHQVLSTRTVVQQKTLSSPSSTSLWGNIDYTTLASFQAIAGQPAMLALTAGSPDSSANFIMASTRGTASEVWDKLPGARKELDSLSTFFRRYGLTVRVDSGRAATEEAFKALSGKSPKLLHVATHGFFLPVLRKTPRRYEDQEPAGNTFSIQQNPMLRSGLVLAGGNHAWKGEPGVTGREDGILTAYEIAQLDLGSTDLVVLSACETALGDLQGNEGVIGLQRAFRLAGAKQLVMSLWRVPDKETTELMMLFYQNWIGGQSTQQALRNAQRKMQEKYPPYYWAAFVTVD